MAKKKSARKKYSKEEKEKILAYVEEVNGSNGRGGPAAAKKKFGVSPLTLKAWQSQQEGPVKGVASTRKNPLRRMGEILDEIDAAEKAIKGLKKEYTQLKKKL